MLGSVKGVDVSLHQGAFNWDNARNQGIKFAVVKATQELFTDPQFKRNQAGARRTMARVGYYHFFKVAISPEAQADYFVKVVGTLRMGEFMVLDAEERGIPPATYQNLAGRFLKRLRDRTGRKPMIYCSPSLANEAGFGIFGSWVDLWEAHWGTKPAAIKGWSGPRIWQYTDSGRIPGHSGNLDLNVAPAWWVYQTQLMVGGAAIAGAFYLARR